MNNEHEVFKGKTFSDLLSDIYTNSKKKESQINGLIRDLQPMIKNLGDATIIVPLIAEYLDVGVKNDDHLIKMASIVQRAMARTQSAESKNGSILTEDEKKQLIAVAMAAEDRGEVNG
jgi:hypothetical protein|tara:strand:- start:292 stop:645 length:354 start_codon:yes stop_codon:yes gene_type:complete